jgi:RimJ/RimL family protein N-acetyltransferase
MITGDHCYIRTADPDDAHAFAALAGVCFPRAILLDARREARYPTVDEVEEMLSSAEVKKSGMFHVVEDLEGRIRGFCSLKPSPPELPHTEIMFAMIDDADYASPMAREAMDFLANKAFVDRPMRKMVAQTLDNEHGFRTFLTAYGYASNGVQREMTWAAGRYHDLETWSFDREAYRARMAGADTASRASAG